MDMLAVINYSLVTSLQVILENITMQFIYSFQILFNSIDSMEAKGMASYSLGLEYAFKQFEEVSQFYLTRSIFSIHAVSTCVQRHASYLKSV